MEIEEAIYARLVGDASVAALIGDRLYPGQGEQDSELPLAVYQQANQRKLQTLTGVINCNQYTMRLDVWAGTYAEAKAVYHAIRNSLVGFQGELGGGQVTVLGVFEDGGEDGVEEPVHDEETGLFRAGLNLSIWYGN
jgi:hypothetical protein